MLRLFEASTECELFDRFCDSNSLELRTCLGFKVNRWGRYNLSDPLRIS